MWPAVSSICACDLGGDLITCSLQLASCLVYLLVALQLIFADQVMSLVLIKNIIIYYLLTESEVITGKSQTEALMY